KDGFDRDIAIEANARPLFAQTASKGDVIDIWSDTDTRPAGAELASRGATFAGSNDEEREEYKNTNHCLAYSSSNTNEESPRKTSETRRRYDLKHAVVRMLRTGLKEDDLSFAVCG